MNSGRIKLSDLSRIINKHKLLIFLSSLISMLVLFPLMHEELYFSNYTILEAFLTIILLMSVYLFNENRSTFLVLLLLVLITISTIWFNYSLGSNKLTLMSLMLEIIYLTITSYLLLKHVLSYRRISADKIYGAISCYILIGLIWALIYTYIELKNPNSFSFSEELLATFDHELSYPLYFAYFIYYSFVTISTLGYGDITPLSHTARVFSFLEAIIGQLYVAILISRLVGLHIIQIQHKN